MSDMDDERLSDRLENDASNAYNGINDAKDLYDKFDNFRKNKDDKKSQGKKTGSSSSNETDNNNGNIGTNNAKGSNSGKDASNLVSGASNAGQTAGETSAEVGEAAAEAGKVAAEAGKATAEASAEVGTGLATGGVTIAVTEGTKKLKLGLDIASNKNGKRAGCFACCLTAFFIPILLVTMITMLPSFLFKAFVGKLWDGMNDFFGIEKPYTDILELTQDELNAFLIDTVSRYDTVGYSNLANEIYNHCKETQANFDAQNKDVEIDYNYTMTKFYEKGDFKNTDTIEIIALASTKWDMQDASIDKLTAVLQNFHGVYTIDWTNSQLKDEPSQNTCPLYAYYIEAADYGLNEDHIMFLDEVLEELNIKKQGRYLTGQQYEQVNSYLYENDTYLIDDDYKNLTKKEIIKLLNNRLVGSSLSSRTYYIADSSTYNKETNPDVIPYSELDAYKDDNIKLSWESFAKPNSSGAKRVFCKKSATPIAISEPREINECLYVPVHIYEYLDKINYNGKPVGAVGDNEYYIQASINDGGGIWHVKKTEVYMTPFIEVTHSITSENKKYYDIVVKPDNQSLAKAFNIDLNAERVIHTNSKSTIKTGQTNKEYLELTKDIISDSFSTSYTVLDSVSASQKALTVSQIRSKLPSSTVISRNRYELCKTALSLVGAVSYNTSGIPSKPGWDGNGFWDYSKSDERGRPGGLNTEGYLMWCLMTTGYENYAVFSSVSNVKKRIASGDTKYFEVINESDLIPGDIAISSGPTQDFCIYIGNGYYTYCNAKEYVAYGTHEGSFEYYLRIKEIDTKHNEWKEYGGIDEIQTYSGTIANDEQSAEYAIASLLQSYQIDGSLDGRKALCCMIMNRQKSSLFSSNITDICNSIPVFGTALKPSCENLVIAVNAYKGKMNDEYSILFAGTDYNTILYFRDIKNVGIKDREKNYDGHTFVKLFKKLAFYN